MEVNKSNPEAPTLKEKTAKGVFWAGTSTIINQVINLVFGVVLARILNAEDYGLVGMLAVFTLIAVILQDGGFTSALTNKKNVEDKDYNAIFWFAFLSSLTMYVILFLSAPFIASFFNEPRLLVLSRVVFLSIIISGLGVVPGAYIFKNLMVKERAISDICSLLISGTVGITMVLNGFSYWSLAIQSMVFFLIGTCMKWYYVRWKPKFQFDFSSLKEMFGFSSKIFMTSIFFHISSNIYTIILGRFYTATQVGYYTQGYKWQTMGASVISEIFSLITQPLFVQAETSNTDPVKVFRKLLRFAAFLSFPLMLGLAFIGKEFITITIGDKWLPCVPILQILCLWGAMLPIWKLYTGFLISKGKSDYYLIINVIIGLSQILFAYIMYPYGIYKMLLVYLLVNFGGLFLCHYYTNKIMKLRIIDVLKDIIPYLLITIGVYLISYLLVYYIDNLYLLFTSKFFIPIILYSLAMIVTKSVMFKESMIFLKQQVLKIK